MKKSFVFLIHGYQFLLSPDTGVLVRYGIKRGGNTCTFYPSCSEYSVLAVEKYGVLKGLFKTLKRVLRCHPWHEPQIDLP